MLFLVYHVNERVFKSFQYPHFELGLPENGMRF